MAKAKPDYSDGQTGGTKLGLPFSPDKPPKEFVVPDHPLGSETFHEVEGTPDENQNPGWKSYARKSYR